MARVGSEDVARLAGVSRSTVSRVFTPGTYVAQATREKVERAALRLGYRPNVLARSLITQRSRIVGVTVGDLDNPLHATLTRRLVRALQDNGYASMLFTAHFDEVDRVIDSLMSYQVEALILCSAVPTAPVAVECAKAGCPLVVLNRAVDSDVAFSVGCDHQSGTRLVADHLVDAGYSRIAFMSGLAAVPGANERGAAFALALEQRGTSIVERVSGEFTYEGATEAMRSLLGGSSRPDALFAANDIMALAAADVARLEFGMRIGPDIGIVGYDNSPATRMASYSLSSVDIGVDAMVREAVKLVLDLHATPKRAVLVEPSLVVRASTSRA
jgi:DNA-binding LacI/PurR family transcriptional regulator